MFSGDGNASFYRTASWNASLGGTEARLFSTIFSLVWDCAKALMPHFFLRCAALSSGGAFSVSPCSISPDLSSLTGMTAPCHHCGLRVSSSEKCCEDNKHIVTEEKEKLLLSETGPHTTAWLKTHASLPHLPSAGITGV